MQGDHDRFRFRLSFYEYAHPIERVLANFRGLNQDLFFVSIGQLKRELIGLSSISHCTHLYREVRAGRRSRRERRHFKLLSRRFGRRRPGLRCGRATTTNCKRCGKQ